MATSSLLSLDELRRRAARVRLVLTDVDGVLTDTGVYYGADGEAMKRFSIRDGMGMEILRDHGIATAMITREDSPRVASRSRHLKLPYYFPGIWDKAAELERVLAETGRTIDELAYIGDDVNDLGIMQRIAPHGILACPGDAMPAIASIVHYQATATGGHGAFRDFAEYLLSLRA